MFVHEDKGGGDTKGAGVASGDQVVLRTPLLKHVTNEAAVLIWTAPVFTERRDSDWVLSLQCDMGKGSEAYEDICMGEIFDYEFPLQSQHTCYFFRLALRFKPARAGGLPLPEICSSSIFVLSQPQAPFMVGIGRNALLEWEPLTNLQGREVIYLIEERVSSGEHNNGDNNVKVVNVGSSMYYAPPDLKASTTYQFRLRIQYRQGEAPRSSWLQYCTAPPPLSINSSPDIAAADTCGACIAVDLPAPHDQSHRLERHGVYPTYRLEGKEAGGKWTILYTGSSPRVLLTEVPRNLVCPLRYMVSLDLRDLPLPQPLQHVASTKRLQHVCSSMSLRSGGRVEVGVQASKGARAFYWDVSTTTLALSSPPAPTYISIASPPSLVVSWDPPSPLNPRPEAPQPPTHFTLEYSKGLKGRFKSVFSGKDATSVDVAALKDHGMMSPKPGAVVRLRLKTEPRHVCAAYSPVVYVVLAPGPLRVEKAHEAAQQTVEIIGPGVLSLLRSLPRALKMSAPRAHVSVRHHAIATEKDLVVEMLPVLVSSAASDADGAGPEEQDNGGDDLVLPYKTRHGRVYSLQLLMRTNHGIAKSVVFTFQTEPKEPGVPEGLGADVSIFKSTTGRRSTFVRISWIPPDCNGHVITVYMVQVRRSHRCRRRAKSPQPSSPGSNDFWDQWQTMYTGMRSSCADVETLNVGHVKAQYRVRACNKLGWGEYSDVLHVEQEILRQMGLDPVGSGSPDQALPASSFSSPPASPVRSGGKRSASASPVHRRGRDDLTSSREGNMACSQRSMIRSPITDWMSSSTGSLATTVTSMARTARVSYDGALSVPWDPTADVAEMELAPTSCSNGDLREPSTWSFKFTLSSVHPAAVGSSKELVQASCGASRVLNEQMEGALKGLRDESGCGFNVVHMKMLTHAALTSAPRATAVVEGESLPLPSLKDLLAARTRLKMELHRQQLEQSPDRSHSDIRAWSSDLPNEYSVPPQSYHCSPRAFKPSATSRTHSTHMQDPDAAGPLDSDTELSKMFEERRLVTSVGVSPVRPSHRIDKTKMKPAGQA